MKNQPSKNMKDMYSSKKEATLKKIQDAIDLIESEGRKVTKKELMDITELSSGTFSQPYVKELLEKNQVCQFKAVKKVSPKEKRAETQSQIIEKLSKSNQKAESTIQNLNIALEKKNEDLKKSKEEYKKLEYEHQLLKGKYQQLLEYLDVLGADLGKFNAM